MNDYNILNTYAGRQDLAGMSFDKINRLCGEIRKFLLENVSQTGGHLASNLGIVELTVAMHLVFNSETDRFIFDVGHQSYVHKILTGRLDGFKNLRKFGGMSGFTKPEESCHDAFVAGHASTAVSVALGMARARTAFEQDKNIIAVIGDGSLTGGLVYEGLNDAGRSQEPLVVILNDNEMSITKNVGGMAKYLAKLRVKPRYAGFKKWYRKVVSKIPGGRGLDRFLYKIKNGIKASLLPVSLFEDMGLKYLGPADGHDVFSIVKHLIAARNLRLPVIVHVKTQKGKGYSHSENHPEQYHGISKFDINEGLDGQAKSDSFSSAFANTIVRLAKKDDKVCAITAAMQEGTGLSRFAAAYEDRFFDVGIAEGHAVTMAAGLAAGGMKPVFAVYSTFLQRAYDMLIHDVAIGKQKIVLAVDRAGLVGEDGETHQGVFDIGFVSQIPGFSIYAPSNYAELDSMFDIAMEQPKSVCVRYPRGSQGGFLQDCSGQDYTILSQGGDITIISYGMLINNALAASEMLERDGVSVQLIKLNKIFPFDIKEQLCQKIIVLEDVVYQGSIAHQLAQRYPGITAINCGGEFVPQGSVAQLQEMLGLDAQSVYRTAKECLKD